MKEPPSGDVREARDSSRSSMGSVAGKKASSGICLCARRHSFPDKHDAVSSHQEEPNVPLFG